MFQQEDRTLNAMKYEDGCFTSKDTLLVSAPPSIKAIKAIDSRMVSLQRNGGWTASSPLRRVLFLLLSLLVFPSTTVDAQDYTCDLVNDACSTKQNSICESSLGSQPSDLDPACRNGDCLDCNAITCGQFEADCGGCLTAVGCYWCPGDGTCNNSPYYGFLLTSSCNAVEDYVAAPDAGFCTNTNTTQAAFSDPLFPAQKWIFDQIRVQPVWDQNITGEGVRVRINDDGISVNDQNETVPELEGRLDLASSCEQFAPLSAADGHGTAVASIVAAQGNNGACGVGIAPGVTLSSCNAFAVQSTTSSFTAYDYLLDTFDISQNSIVVQACVEPSAEDEQARRRQRKELRRNKRRDLQGDIGDDDEFCPFEVENAEPCDVCDFSIPTAISPSPITPACEQAIVRHCENNFFRDEWACLDFVDTLLSFGNRRCDYNRVPTAMLDAMANGITNGRNGKGILYVFASGNDFAVGDDVNFGGLTNSRLTITVGAVGHDERHASYSTGGAAVLVSAPGGDLESLSNHVAATIDGTCTTRLTGTSFSCPVVSGVIALMLQVNPDLTWRDVQGILAQTSRSIVADTNDESRVTNGAGLVHSNWYGFGIVNAEAAVEAAEDWNLYCPETFVQVESGLVNAIISDDSSTTPITNIISVDGNSTTTISVSDFIVESVVVLLDVQHFSRGDLEVSLVSPMGTTSLLHPGPRPENTQRSDDDVEERWKLMTVRNWGESPVGNWTLSVKDVRLGDLDTCIDAPFRTRYENVDIDCLYLSQGFCANGSPTLDTVGSELLTLQVEGFTMEDACCACGGGFTTTSFDDQLIQWRLVLYGRQQGTAPCDEDTNTTTPSTMPSTAPSPPPTTKKTKSSANQNTVEAEKDPQERAATIAASIIAFLLAGLCIFCILRDPSSSSKNRFSNNNGNTNGGDDSGGFESAEGAMKNVV